MAFSITDIVGDSLGEAVKKIVGTFKLDPAKKAEFQAAIDANEAAFRMKELEMEAKTQDAINAGVAGQIDIDKIEAASPSLFKSGWRPAAGWVCVSGLAYAVLGQPLLTWGAAVASALFKIPAMPAAPVIDTSVLMSLLFALLGLGAIRMKEKIKGVATA